MHQTEYDTGFIPLTRLFRSLKMQTNVDALDQKQIVGAHRGFD
jgi:hypothetical protein